jgi:hypothetical protein
MDNAARLAGVMELVDVPDSKSGARNGVGVRVPPPAPSSDLKKFKRSPTWWALPTLLLLALNNDQGSFIA